MNQGKILAVCIEPNKKPTKIEFSAGVDGFFEIINKLNTDSNGNSFKNREGFDVIQVTKSLHIFVRKESDDVVLPLNKTIGHVNLYGTIILANMDSMDELTSISQSEATYYCMIFAKDTVALESFKNLLK